MYYYLPPPPKGEKKANFSKPKINILIPIMGGIIEFTKD